MLHMPKLMLAATAPTDLTVLKYPLLASAKIDGVRAVVLGDGVYSRNGKLIPNEYVQRKLRATQSLVGCDGELVVGAPFGEDVFNRSQSGVMSRQGEPDFTFHVFDHIDFATEHFHRRLARAHGIISKSKHAQRVAHQLVCSAEELEKLEVQWLAEGYEGAMLRDPDGAYKHGRSTVREGGLLKLKRFADSEMRVTAVHAQKHNANAAEKDELGRTKRSSAKAGLVTLQALGAVEGVDIHTGQKVYVGTGFTNAERIALWHQGYKLLGRVARYRYFPSGTAEAPRFPVFAGWRYDAL